MPETDHCFAVPQAIVYEGLHSPDYLLPKPV